MFKALTSKNTIFDRVVYGSVFSILRSVTGAVSNFLLARWLGPSTFGDFAFLLASFLAFRSLIDFGLSHAFFTFFSEQKRGKNFLFFYWGWIFFQFFLIASLISLVIPEVFLQTLLPDQPRHFVLFAFMAVFAQGTIWATLVQMAEAARETVLLQMAGLFVAVFHLCLLSSLYLTNALTISAIFAVIFLEWIVATFLIVTLFRHRIVTSISTDIKEDISKVAKEVLVYCLPFIPYTLISFAHDFFDRWLLQTWGGSAQQGLFAVSQQLSIVSVLLITSMMRVFWKEVAEANNERDLSRLATLYQSVNAGFFLFAVVISCYFLPFSKTIITVTVGEAYAGGHWTLALMLVYPIHQTLGQIVLTFFFATRMVAVSSAFGIFFMVAGSALSYFLLSPVGLNMSATGHASLAIASKLVAIQFIQITLMQFYLAKKFNWTFSFVGQLKVFITLLATGALSRYVAWLLVSNFGWLAEMITAGIFFGCAVVVLIKIHPNTVGLSPRQIYDFKAQISQFLQRK